MEDDKEMDGSEIEASSRNGVVWCGYCECWINTSELKRWTGDDRLHWLCPGCDDDLVPVDGLEGDIR
jgi:hypothetical protein